MIKLAFIFSMLFFLNATTITNKNLNNFNSECDYELNQEIALRASLLGFNVTEEIKEIDWDTIEIIEIEEEIDLSFDAKKHLPKNFCAYSGMI